MTAINQVMDILGLRSGTDMELAIRNYVLDENDNKRYQECGENTELALEILYELWGSKNVAVEYNEDDPVYQWFILYNNQIVACGIELEDLLWKVIMIHKLFPNYMGIGTRVK